MAAGLGGCGSCSRWVRQLVQVGVAGPVGCETGIFGCGRCSRKTLKFTTNWVTDTHTNSTFISIDCIMLDTINSMQFQ